MYEKGNGSIRKEKKKTQMFHSPSHFIKKFSVVTLEVFLVLLTTLDLGPIVLHNNN